MESLCVYERGINQARCNFCYAEPVFRCIFCCDSKIFVVFFVIQCYTDNRFTKGVDDMYRSAIEKLKKWKDSYFRKPLIIEGARQVGKTWLMKEFGE